MFTQHVAGAWPGVSWPIPSGVSRPGLRLRLRHASGRGAGMGPRTAFSGVPDVAISLDSLAHSALSGAELARWMRFDMPWRRDEWLLGRLAAKATVCEYLEHDLALRAAPCEVEIVPDAHGCPRVVSPWLDGASTVPLLSIAHAEGLAVAALAFGDNIRGLGVDLELPHRVSEDAARLAFSDEERAVLNRMVSIRPQCLGHGGRRMAAVAASCATSRAGRRAALLLLTGAQPRKTCGE